METIELRKQRLLNIIDFSIQLIKMNSDIKTDYKEVSPDFHFTDKSLLDYKLISLNNLERESWLSVPRLQHTLSPTITDKLLREYIILSPNYKIEPQLKISQLSIELDQIKAQISNLKQAAILNNQSTNNEDASLPILPLTEQQKLEELSLRQQQLTNLLAQLQSAFQDYLTHEWLPWAQNEAEVSKTSDLYNKLYQFHNAAANSDQELIFGIGVIHWTNNQHKICFPLLTIPVEVILDTSNFTIDLLPQLTKYQLELEVLYHVEPDQLKQLKDYVTSYLEVNEQITPFEIQTFADIIKFAVGILDAQGIYVESHLATTIPKTDNLLISDSWVLFKRKKSKTVVLNELERFKQHITRASEISGAISNLVTTPSDQVSPRSLPNYRGLSNIWKGDPQTANDLFFPLPYNDEQVQIIQQLDLNNGVVVQGPPGTGKTHTIANIICHYLALGKRILVTSVNSHPLAVIQEKLPNEINDLVIALVEDDRKGLKKFEKSVANIAHKVQEIIPHEYEAKINELGQTINSIHSQIAQIDSQLSQIANKNYAKIRVDNKELEAYQAVQLVFGPDAPQPWPLDDITIEDSCTPLFDENDVIRFNLAQHQVGAEIKYIDYTIPALENLPDGGQLLQVHHSLLHKAEIINKQKTGVCLPFSSENEQIITIASNLLPLLERLTSDLTSIIEQNWWTGTYIANLTATNASLVNYLHKEIIPKVESFWEARQQFILREVTLPANCLDNPNLLQGISNLAKGKRPFGLFGKKAERQLIKQIKIAMKEPATADDWQHVQKYCNINQELLSLTSTWNSLAKELKFKEVSTATLDLNTIKELMKINSVLANLNQINEQFSSTRQALTQVFAKDIQLTLNNNIIRQATLIINSIKSNLEVVKLNAAQIAKNEYIAYLTSYPLAMAKEALQFCHLIIGVDSTISESDLLQQWDTLYSEIARISKLQHYFPDLRNFLHKLAQSGAEQEAQALKSNHARTLPNNPLYCWEVKRLHTYLKNIQSPELMQQLLDKRAQLVKRLAHNYQEIVTTRSWLKIYENLTPRVKTALTSFAQSIRAIGKGTGKKADYFRKAAQDAAKEAVTGIPCWIMPHYKISENLPDTLCDFDLVIIDEASQSDFSALPALLRANKILVVGDDKQVSPEHVGLNLDKVEQIRYATLANQIPQFKAQITPERSIYDLFKVIFADSQIMLKEHFRCVPEIIEYSRKHFYDNQLVPLRIPNAKTRIDYPLVDVYIAGGYRDDYKNINEHEANFIIEEIYKLTHDERYSDKSIGVISLLADKQAHLIMSKLINKIGIELYEKHQIVCGDARTFQGKEKDIMFLSLVVSSKDGKPPLALGREAFAQRYNVAMSRARDRVYLVRSIQAHELSPNDELRRNLLEHFRPSVTTNQTQDVAYAPELCDSDFERDIYQFLVEHGYAVTPQYKVGNFRIDLVVESPSGARLAVECDGDRYHGPERWDYDIRRQRILERSGWKFWRCFASQFYRNKEMCHQDLLNTLAEMGITPGQTSTANTHLHIDYQIASEQPIELELPTRNNQDSA